MPHLYIFRVLGSMSIIRALGKKPFFEGARRVWIVHSGGVVELRSRGLLLLLLGPGEIVMCCPVYRLCVCSQAPRTSE